MKHLAIAVLGGAVLLPIASAAAAADRDDPSNGAWTSAATASSNARTAVATESSNAWPSAATASTSAWIGAASASIAAGIAGTDRA